MPKLAPRRLLATVLPPQRLLHIQITTAITRTHTKDNNSVLYIIVTAIDRSCSAAGALIKSTDYASSPGRTRGERREARGEALLPICVPLGVYFCILAQGLPITREHKGLPNPVLRLSQSFLSAGLASDTKAMTRPDFSTGSNPAPEGRVCNRVVVGLALSLVLPWLSLSLSLYLSISLSLSLSLSSSFLTFALIDG